MVRELYRLQLELDLLELELDVLELELLELYQQHPAPAPQPEGPPGTS